MEKYNRKTENFDSFSGIIQQKKNLKTKIFNLPCGELPYILIKII